MSLLSKFPVKACIHQIHDLFRIEDSPGVVDQILVGIEGFGGKLRRVVLFDEVEDLGADEFRDFLGL